MQFRMQNGMFVPQEHQSDKCFLDIGNNSHRYHYCLRSQSMRDRKKDMRSAVTFRFDIFHFLPCEMRCRLYKLTPNHGMRFGEAKNPGPEQLFTFCATNPTALFNKTSAVLSLDAHCTFLSETSATKCAQMSISQDFATTTQKFFWGKPVLPPKCATQGRLVARPEYRSRYSYQFACQIAAPYQLYNVGHMPIPGNLAPGR